MKPITVRSFERVIPMIYAYTTPGVEYHNGWVKIGYTEKQTVKERIDEQTHTADVRWKLAWQNNAIYNDGSGEYFTDRDFHRYLTGVKGVERTPSTEWFHLDPALSREYFFEFASREQIAPISGEEYSLRDEQRRAVTVTNDYFSSGGTEFLWNAKPRFGKTLSCYDLIRQMGAVNVLIVTNRPSIANSWLEDFNKFISWRGEMCFVSENAALSGKEGVMSRDEYVAANKAAVKSGSPVRGMIAFESLQSLKGSVYFGGHTSDKLQWIAKEYTDSHGTKTHGINFDLLIIDEAQEGVDTMRTDRAFRGISRKHTLYLSGTPFKALASGQFSSEQIFNWVYADEQEKKRAWNGEGFNPYESLPQLAMFTYQMSDIVYDQAQAGVDLSDDETTEYAFDLNEFFATNENGRFIHESDVKKFLHALKTGVKYPFSTPQLRSELSHTLWLLNRVDSCKALAKLLREDDVFGEYEIILAAGDGRLEEDDALEKAYDKVKQKVLECEKTITLSVGQLTVGVTIPQWSGVMMLCNMKSPSSYMQAAFRAQNPCIFSQNGQRLRKETAYVFDFDPARTLIIFDEFANNLGSGTSNNSDRKENIKRLLNFFPVLGEDENGEMVELDAEKVLSVPRRLKSREVVRRGFMSNFLFQNISGIFGAANAVIQIVEKLTPAHEEGGKNKSDALKDAGEVHLDENGDADVPHEIIIGKTQDIFGDKVYEYTMPDLTLDNSGDEFDYVIQGIKDLIKRDVLVPAMEEYDVKKGTQKRIERETERDIEEKFTSIEQDFSVKQNIAKAEYERKLREAENESQLEKAETEYKSTLDDALNEFNLSVKREIEQTMRDKPQEVVERLEKNKEEMKKRSIEDDVRAHLRGFARTIPSFIMAYGDENLCLANFDDYTEDDVFFEVTGISEDEFRFLRDGGDYFNEQTGKNEHFAGHLFDEVVFNDSVTEFLKKKAELANYFDETHTEDIFDYIPPQKTNQIFTPKWVVQKMVDELEQNNPGCFDNPNATFADLYMKSGLYIAEIVKRLFRSEKMKSLYPDENARLKHIFNNQVYGMAPTRIIYLIATNYILGFDETLKAETKNFVQADAAEAAKTDSLEYLVNEYFN